MVRNVIKNAKNRVKTNQDVIGEQYSMKKVLKIWQENTFVGVSFLINLRLRPATLFKKRLQQGCFAVNFVKFLRAPIL